MLPPAFPENERQRLEALTSLDILDTPADERFERITRIAQRHFNVPIALVSLVDARRQWFKSKQGLDANETPRDISFCGHAILGDEVFVVKDALEDPRFCDNPLVTDEPRIRFYAGAPLATPDGLKLGTLCVIDRRPREFDQHARALLSALGQWVVRELDFARDLSRIAARLESKLHLATVLDNVTEAVISADADGHIESVNRAAEGVFGYSQPELLQIQIRALLPERDREKHDAYLAHLKTQGLPFSRGAVESVGLRKDGSEFEMEISFGMAAAGGARMLTGLVRDITARKQLDKMKSEFISTVSHELRTPLTSIKGSLGLVKSGTVGAIPDKLKRMLDIAYENSDRLVRLINDILDIEKIAAGKMEFSMAPLELEPLLERAIEANREYGAQYGVSFVLTESVAQAQVEGDHGRLMQVLANLLSNAAKFSPRASRVEIALRRHGNGFRIAVADQGPGIPKEFRGRIFQRFAQADSSDTRQKGGTGLGLSITRAIVERHGGAIGFDTEPGKGTTFYFDLPERN